jgi:glycerate 2-kinase
VSAPRILIAPDKFKGSLTAAQVARALADGLARAGLEAHELPLADGGDGSVEAAVAAGFRRVPVSLGEGRSCDLAVDEVTGTTVIEVAGTCGLFTAEALRPAAERSTTALGTAVLQARLLGARRIVLALGGSSTTDGGIGLLHALGARFRTRGGSVLPPTAASLAQVDAVDLTGLVDLSGVDLVLATDVDNPLCGPSGCVAVFGPQKGLTDQELAPAEAGLRHFVQVLARTAWPRAADLAAFPGAGAAGGLGWAGMLLGGTQTSGAEYFLELLAFDAMVERCDVVLTGEGCLDPQTAGGKLPCVVAAHSGDRPVIAVVGRCDVPAEDYGQLGLAEVYSISQIAGRDTSQDPTTTTDVLQRLGVHIAEELAGARAAHVALVNTEAAGAR